MAFGFQERIARRFDEEIRFFKGWMHGPKTVGSIMPTSVTAARSMASLVNPASGLPVLELGPGTGVITRAILARGLLPENLVSVEYSQDFYARLMADMPCVNFIQGDAFNLADTLGPWRDQKFDSVVSGIPMLNFPMEQRVALLEDLLDRIPAGRPVVQFSYGPSSPIAPRRGNYTVAHHDFVMRNVPPARLWVYRREI